MLHLLLADLPLSAPAFARLLTEPGLPATAALCRQAVVLEQEAPRDDAQAAWLTPAERWLLHALRLPGDEAEQAPWARLAALADGVSEVFPEDQPLGLLTPAHLRLGRDSLSLTDPNALDLTVDEAQQLFAAIEPLFDGAGWRLRWVTPLRWYAAHPSLREVVTAGAARAQGRNVAAWMPGGPAARPWRQLLTEVQMTWQHHPVNEAREQRGLPDVNTLWLHGCGPLPPDWCSPMRLAEPDQHLSDPALEAALRGLALRPGAGALSRLHFLDAQDILSGDPVAGLRQLDAQLAAALQQELERDAGARLTLAGEHRWRTLQIRRPHGWKFWQRTELLQLCNGL
ncbi:hypothetical protein [Thiomonas bhubaneswarensis]|uniref:Regulatory protein, RpfE type n=1 Tax=Thiomonas bhubaneswarensis TaxID=339866 RepID=A0A0K6I444_9BURK|nr:hypothetical protein [Thiomonas bhubaneswarensis]CUA98062.1 Uncharacterized protein Ga0061069_106195 [Thiomonas bhubaneswarensis]